MDVDQGIETSQEREERLVRPRGEGDELVHPEGTSRVLILPSGELVEDVALHPTLPLVDGNVPVLLGQDLLPVSPAPAYAERMPPRLGFVGFHQGREVSLPMVPEMALLGAGREIGGLEAVLDDLAGQLVTEDPVEGVREGREQRQGD